MSTPHSEDTKQAIYDDLPYTHPEEWAAIQKQWGEGASLGRENQEPWLKLSTLYL